MELVCKPDPVHICSRRDTLHVSHRTDRNKDIVSAGAAVRLPVSDATLHSAVSSHHHVLPGVVFWSVGVKKKVLLKMHNVLANSLWLMAEYTLLSSMHAHVIYV